MKGGIRGPGIVEAHSNVGCFGVFPREKGIRTFYTSNGALCGIHILTLLPGTIMSSTRKVMIIVPTSVNFKSEGWGGVALQPCLIEPRD